MRDAIEVARSVVVIFPVLFALALGVSGLWSAIRLAFIYGDPWLAVGVLVACWLLAAVMILGYGKWLDR